MKLVRTTGVVVLVLSAGSLALADDLFPPPWRGQPGTTFAEWDFLTSNPNPPPDLEVNPYGSADLHLWPGLGQLYYPEWGGRQGVWPLSGTLEVTIPNRNESSPYKDIWIQLTWTEQVPRVTPEVLELLSGEGATVVREIELDETGQVYPVGDHWIHTTYLIHIEPNPAWETIKISGGIMVDQLVIDTICIPEPTALLLILAGPVVATLRRRRP